MNKNKFILKKYLYILTIVLTFLFLMTSCNSSINKTFQIDPDKMFVHYIDVGQGDCILIQINNKNLLIDSGPNSDKDKLFDYLSNLDLKKLDYVIATHPHEDHIGNMDDIIKNYYIAEFFAPRVQSTTKTFEKMIDALKSKNLKINVLKKDTDSINLGKNTKVTVFSPINEYYENLNNYSPVIKIEYGNTSFLFTGDAEKDIEKEILNNNEDIRADVLKVGHHGSSTSTSKDFLKGVDPSIAVISVGKDNMYNHPDEVTMKLLAANKIKTYRTDKDGTICLISDSINISKR